MWDWISDLFGSGSDEPTTTPIDGGSATQVDSPALTWDPDKGWLDAAGKVVYSGADASSTNYDTGVVNQLAMTPGIEAMQGAFGTSFDTAGWLSNLVSTVGGSTATKLVNSAMNPSTGKVDVTKLLALAGGVGMGLSGLGNTKQQSVGYQGGIPTYTAVREQVPQTYDPNRRPGSRGQEYFSQTQFAKPEGVAAAQEAVKAEAAAAAERNKARRSEYAAGGIATLAKGRYLAGGTDGMADKIPATISDKQPAKLSHGEFVIPADVVSHLGNGNSEAGANRLYDMMDKVRKARTGTTKQGKQINPNKYMPG